MKLKLKRILFVINFLLIGISNFSYAQQNLFNIPSGDITIKNKIFYQHQLNGYSDKLESKAHFVYGLGKGWDLGVNLVGKGFYFTPEWRIIHNDNPNKGALYPVIMGTIQKQFAISKNFDVNFGSQIGWNLSNRIENKEINYFFMGLVFIIFTIVKVGLLGAYIKLTQCLSVRVTPLGH